MSRQTTVLLRVTVDQTVDDLHAVLARLRAHGAELARDVVQ